VAAPPDRFRPDLLADVKVPYNPVLKIRDLTDRVDDLERFYGIIALHSRLDGIKEDDHTQYALAISTSNRAAAEALRLSSVDKKSILFFDNGVLQFTGLKTSTSATAGGATALPATPKGYAWAKVDGVMVRIPYYLP